MARSDLKIQIDAESARAEAAFDRVSRSTMRMEGQLRQAGLAAASLDKQLEDEANRAAQQRADVMEKLGRGLVTFGVATLAGLGMATKAAIDWESAWAGVRKTVDGTPEQLAALESELRELATTLPASHQEIAAVAEAAGQLGIATPDVAKFTETMIHLGETTNLTADEAATAIAQMMNVMQTAPDDVDNLAAALVDLGNNGASTEKEILQMAQRISGAAAQIGMSEADVLAMANALASVGIRAEAGGTAVSTVMSDMAKSVAEGGSELETLAEVAGISASDFATAFREDPAEAIMLFVEGLGGVEAAGGNVFAVLDELGFGSVRTRDALLRLAGGGDILRESLERGEQAWDDNTALIREAEQRYDTAEAKIQIAKNTLVDMAIDIGGVILPAVSELAEGVSDIIGWFSDLPGPVKTAVTIFGGLVGVAATVGGGFLLLAPRIAAARTEMQILSATAPKVAGALRGMTMAAGAVGVLLAVAGAIYTVAEAAGGAEGSIADWTEELLNARDGVANGELIQGMLDARDTVERLGETHATSRMVMSEWTEGVESADAALADMVNNGNAEAAAEAAFEFAKRLGMSDEEARKFVEESLPQYQEAMKGVENANRMAAESTAPMDQSLVALGNRFGATGDDAEKAAQDMLDSWAESAGSFVDFNEAYDTALSEKEERERETAQATADATEDQSDSWEDYIGDVTLTADEYLAQLDRMVENQEQWRSNMLTIAGKIPDGMLAELAEAGPEMADEVAVMAQMSTAELEHAGEQWEKTQAANNQGLVDEFTAMGPLIEYVMREHGKAAADNLAAEITAGETTVQEAMDRLNVVFENGMIMDADVHVGMDASDFWIKADGVSSDINRLDEGTALPVAGLDDGPLQEGAAGAHNTLDGVDGRRPNPQAGFSIKEIEERSAVAHGTLDVVNGRRPTPTAGMDISPLEERSSSAHGQLDRVNDRRPVPVSNLDNEPLGKNARSAHLELDRVDGRRPTPLSNLENNPLDRNAVDAHRKLDGVDQRRPNPKARLDLDTTVADRQLKEWKEDIKVKFKATFEGFLGNVFGGGGGGGGGFGGQAQGGWRNPMNKGSYRVGGGVGSYPGHTGLDLPAPTGTGVYAARAGRVSRSMSMRGSYGNHVYIDHGGGYQTRYAHLSSRNVSAGQMVGSGRRIGSVGSTGNSTGPHLHFEVRKNGGVRHPRSYIRFAKGGVVEGPGTGTSDNVPAWLSNGEYVTKAAAVNHYGKEFMHKVNNMELPKIPHMASGGLVGSAPSGGNGGGCTHLNISTPMSEVVATVRRELRYDQKARQLSGRF